MSAPVTSERARGPLPGRILMGPKRWLSLVHSLLYP
jgi:hypothetical protein